MIDRSLPTLPLALGITAAAIMLLALVLRGVAGAWALPIVTVPILIALALGFARVRSGPNGTPVSSEDGLKARYARGEILRHQYQDELVEILADRYASGMLGLEEYERQAARVFSWKGATPGEQSVRGGTTR